MNRTSFRRNQFHLTDVFKRTGIEAGGRKRGTTKAKCVKEVLNILVVPSCKMVTIFIIFNSNFMNPQGIREAVIR